MTNELIKIEERNGMSAVNARELHQVLGSKQQFGNWITNRIEKYGFVENQDFEVFNNFINNPDGGRPTKEIPPSSQSGLKRVGSFSMRH